MNLTCLFSGHKYITEVHFDNDVQKIKCGRCPKTWAKMKMVEKLIKWTLFVELDIMQAYPEHEYFKK